jgi:hypothetical protein
MRPVRKLVQAAILFAAAAVYTGTPANASEVSCETMRSDCYALGGGESFWFHSCTEGSCGMHSCGVEPGSPSECCWEMPVGDCGIET